MRSAIAFVLGALFAAGCGHEATPSEPPKVTSEPGVRRVRFDGAALQRLGVRTSPAGGGAVEGLTFTGALEYDLERYAEIGTPIEGRVATVDARPGDRVKKGQRLATILVPSLASAQADVVTARAAARVSTEHARREAALLDERLTTAREAEVAGGEKVRADAQLAAARARLTALGITSVPNDAIDAAGALSLTAPLAGVVVRRDAALGSFLEPRETAFVVADASKLWATIQIYEFDIRYVQVGTEARITFDALPGTSRTAKVALIEPELGTATRALRARIPIDNADGALRAGLFLRASVAIPPTGDLLRVPVGAVQPVGEEDVVFVERAAGDYEVRPVRVARRGPQLVEIAGGLAPGEPIVTEGAFVLRGELARQ